jgi:uracil-DNA glycosylase family 4
LRFWFCSLADETAAGRPSLRPAKLAQIVGEAPGQEEDAQGKPFVGKAGKLLDDIFTYAGFDMDRQVYLTNVAKRRPPNNRNPTQEEIDFYLPILLEEIRLVDPSLIILAGSVPLQAVLNLKGITAARGNVFPVERAGRTRDVMPIFHPAYLLRNKAKKREMLVGSTHLGSTGRAPGQVGGSSRLADKLALRLPPLGQVDINEIRAKYLAMFPADELAPPRATKPVRSP